MIFKRFPTFEENKLNKEINSVVKEAFSELRLCFKMMFFSISSRINNSPVELKEANKNE